MLASATQDWTLSAKCAGMGDIFFTEGSAQRRITQICAGCPVRLACLAEALDDRIEWGVWGGMTERERRRLLRQRPDVTSWKKVLLSTGSADA
jgi:WhiB family redox-sensing transcriptional regulator